MGAHKNLFNVMFVPVLAMATLVLSTAANAALMQFSDKTAFENEMLTVQNIDFDSLSPGFQPDMLNFLDENGNKNAFFWTTDGSGLFKKDGPVFGLPGEFLAAQTSGDIRITFGDDISAIGLDVGALDNVDGVTFSFKLTYQSLVETSGSINIGGGVGFSFLGLISDLGDFKELYLEITNGVTHEAIDNVILGVVAPPSAVPVPAALPLFGTGIACLSFMNWRRRRRAV